MCIWISAEFDQVHKELFLFNKGHLVYADDPFRYFECVVVQKGQQLKAG